MSKGLPKKPRRARRMKKPKEPPGGAEVTFLANARKRVVDEALEAPNKNLVVQTLSRQALERERDVLSTALKEEMRELGRRSFWFFLTNILFPTVWEEHYSEIFHKPICDEIQNVPQGEDLWLILAREFRKTYLINIGRHIWMIIRDANIRLMLVGAREETVKPFARLIRSAFIAGTPGFETFQEVYSDFVLPTSGGHLRQAFQFTHPLRTKVLADPTFRATYLGVTGAGWRCDQLTYDDVIERRNVTTPDQAAKSLRNMLDLLPLVHTGSPYRNIFGAGCLTAEAQVTLESGERKPIVEVQVGEKVWAADVDGSFTPRKVEARIPQGEQPTLEIQTTSHSLRATENHPFLIVDEATQNLCWRRADTLEKGDLLVSMKSIPGELEHPWMTEEFFWLFGFMLGDGWVGAKKKRGYVCFAVGKDAAVNAKAWSLLREWFPQCPFYRTPFGYIRSDNYKAAEALAALGLRGSARTKRLPPWVLKAPPEFRRAALRGFCDADGHNGDHESWTVEIANEGLLTDLRHLASLCGVRTGKLRFRRRTVKAPNSPTPVVSEFWASNFNFGTVERHEMYGATFKARLPQEVRVERVVSIKEAGIEKVYDLTVEGTPSFFANGLAVHNTRWSYLDPYGRIIGEDSTGEGELEEAGAVFKNRKIRVMIRHGLENPNKLCTRCPKHVVKAYPHGEFDLKDPDAVPPDAPVHTRQMILDRYDEYTLDPDKGESLFYHQYGNICMSPKDQKFEREWFATATFPYFPVQKRRVLSIDAADKDFAMETGGDYMVALFGEFDDFGRLLLVWGIRSNRWTRKTFINRIVSWCSSTGWWPNIAVKEKFGDSGNFLTDLRDAFAEVGQVPHIKAVTRPGVGTTNFMKKMDWIVAALQAPMENGMVVFGRDFPKVIKEQGIEEGVKLGQTRNDDVIDCMTLFMAEGVRLIVNASKHGAAPVVPHVPDLDLYHPDAPAGPPMAFAPDLEGRALNPMEAALEAKKIQGIAEEVGGFTTQRLTPPEIDVDFLQDI